MSSPDSSPEPTGVDLERRRALRLSGGALAVVIGVGAGWLDRRGSQPAAESAGPTPSTSTTAATSTTTQLEPIEIPEIGEVDPGIIRIGRRYLDNHPDEAELRQWLAALPTDVDDPIVHAAAIVADEFGSGTIVDIDGWVLAESEARAAAVVAVACGATC